VKLLLSTGFFPELRLPGGFEIDGVGQHQAGIGVIAFGPIRSGSYRLSDRRPIIDLLSGGRLVAEVDRLKTALETLP